MAEHTPGPWAYAPTPCTSREGTRIVHRVRSDHPECGYFVAVCDDYHADCENEPNARLIAASPELFASCQEMREFIRTSKAKPGETPYDILCRASFAIAKATGGTL